MDLSGKRVLVTGSASGMGRAIAVAAAANGAEFVTVADLDSDGAQQTVEQIEAAGGRAAAVTVDLTSTEDIRTMVDASFELAGGLDTLVNNAGILDHQFDADPTVEGLAETSWDRVFDVNVKAVWLATKFAAPHLRASDRGPSIVNAASVSGITGYPTPAYSASKGAVIQLTRTTAIALSPTVRCNAYAPGSFDTPMARLNLERATDRDCQFRSMVGAHLIPRFGDPAELAHVACFLASDHASFMTGAIVPVDGGTTAWRGLRD